MYISQSFKVTNDKVEVQRTKSKVQVILDLIRHSFGIPKLEFNFVFSIEHYLAVHRTVFSIKNYSCVWFHEIMSISSWSEPFNSKVFFLKESYHRVLVNINLNSHNPPPVDSVDLYQTLLDHYFLHFCFSWDSSVPFNLGIFESRLEQWRNVLFSTNITTPHKRVASLSIPISFASEITCSSSSATQNLIASFIQLFLFDVQQNTNTTQIRTMIQQAFPTSSLLSSIPVGLINFSENDDILDAFLQREASFIPQLSLCGVTCGHRSTTDNELLCDNLRARPIELIHSYGYNSLISFPSDSSFSILDKSSVMCEHISKRYQSMSDKYQVSPLCCFGKMYLQLGVFLLTPPIGGRKDCGEYGSNEFAILLENWSRIVHPFVHRKLFVSEFRKISLYIDDDDMEEVLRRSEDIECRQDNERIAQFATVAPIIPTFRFG